MGRVFLVLLLLGAALAQEPSAPGVLHFPGLLARGAAQAKVMSQKQESVSRVAWGSNPRCMAIYLNAPSWATYNIQLSVAPITTPSADPLATPGMDPQCLQDAVRWRAVVVGAEDLPRPLAVAVGWEMPLRSNNYTESALYSELPPDDDYSTAPPTLDTQDRQALLRGTWDCLSAQLDKGLASEPLDLRACLANVTLPGGARPPPPPPPPRPPKKGGIRRKVARARKDMGLAPFLRFPEHLSSTNPNRGMHNPVYAAKADYNTFELQADSCAAGFGESGFHTNTLRHAPTQTYDSCFYTMTIVYVYYDGSCDNGNLDPLTSNVLVTVAATYTDYNGCNQDGMLRLGRALVAMLWVLSIPVVLFLLFLVAPTIGRIFYRMWMSVYLFCLPKSRADTIRKHRMRMEMETPLRWKWLQRLRAVPWIAAMIRVRKRLVYSALTIFNPNGRNRFLMVIVVATVATSVSVMVWRPQTQLVLSSNPTEVTMQLDNVEGPYNSLSRYFQISAASLFLGCLAYLMSLTNTNTPLPDDVLLDGAVGRRWSPWWVQRAIALSATAVLFFLLVLQTINITLLLPVISDRMAYTWIVVVQFVNVCLMAAMQLDDIIMVQREVRLRVRPGSSPPRRSVQAVLEAVFVAWEHLMCPPPPPRLRHASSLGPLEAAAALHGIALSVGPEAAQPNSGPQVPERDGGVNAVLTKSNTLLRPSYQRSHVCTDAGQATEATRAQDAGREAAGRDRPAGGEAATGERMGGSVQAGGEEVPRKNRLLHWWRGDRNDRFDEGLSEEEVAKRRREDEQEVQVNVFRQMQMICMEALGEESITVTWKDNTFTSPTFRYPSWLLASVLEAFIMLIFHYCKSLGFGKSLAHCVESWSECDVEFIRNFATTYSFEQLGALRASAHGVAARLSGLKDVEVLINAVLGAGPVTTSLGELGAMADDIEHFATPGNSDRAMWVEEYGKRLSLVVTLSFTFGLILGLFTLAKALHSFKAISKKHRLLLITRRLLASKAGGQDTGPQGMEATGALQALNMVMGTMQRCPTMQRCATMRRHPLTATRLATMRRGRPRPSSDTALHSVRPSHSHPASLHHSPTLAMAMRRAPSAPSAGIPAVTRLATAVTAPTIPAVTGMAAAVTVPTVPVTHMAAPITPTSVVIPVTHVATPVTPPKTAIPTIYIPGTAHVCITMYGGPEIVPICSPVLENGPDHASPFSPSQLNAALPPTSLYRLPAPPGPSASSSYVPAAPRGPAAHPLLITCAGSAAGSPLASPLLSVGRTTTTTSSDDDDGGDGDDGGSSGDDDDDDDDDDDELKRPLKEPEVFGVTTLAAFRALNAHLPTAVFFLGVLLSCAVVQLYSLGIIISAALAFILHPSFWTGTGSVYWPYILMFIFVILLNKGLVVGLIGSQYVTNGRQILRPAGWVAFLIVTSITNLVLGLPIAIIRLVWLVLTSILAVGLLDRTVLAIGYTLDMPHNAFLATVYLQDGVGKADARSFRPGGHWRAVKRWRGATNAVVRLGGVRYARLVARNQQRARWEQRQEEEARARQEEEERARHVVVEVQEEGRTVGPELV